MGFLPKHVFIVNRRKPIVAEYLASLSPSLLSLLFFFSLLKWPVKNNRQRENYKILI